jgi:hypothetical protein
MPFDTATRGHHPDSPSGLQASEACPLFANEQRESQASIDGVLQHKAAETRDLSLLDGNELWIKAVKECIAYEDKLIASLTRKDPFGKGHPPQVLREVYLPVGDDIISDAEGVQWFGITGGFPDVVIVGFGEAHIPDWKFGKIPVTPTKDNLQGIAYAVAAFRKFTDISRVTVHFFAPHQGWSEKDHGRLYVHTFSRSELPQMELRIRTVVARKRAAVKALEEKKSWSAATPKTDLCIWCSRKGDCPKLHAVVIRGAEKHQDFIVPEVVNTYQLSRPDQYKQAFRWANAVELIAKAIKKRVADVALTEDMDFGGELKVVKRVDRKIKSVRELARVAKQFGITFRELLEIATVSITGIEKKIKERSEKGRGAERLRQFDAEAREAGAIEDGFPVYFVQEAKTPREKSERIIELA